MDIYSTSFCLPRNPLTHELSPSTSFDYGSRDGAGRAGASTGGANGTSLLQQQQQQTGGLGQQSQGAAGLHSTANSVDSSPSFAHSSPTTLNRTSNSSLSTDASSTNGLHGGTGTDTSVGSRGSMDLNDAMQRLCVDAMAAHQCLVSFTALDPANFSPPQPSSTLQQKQPSPQIQQQQLGGSPVVPPGHLINFHLSGGYQQVMSARGSLLRDNPFKVSLLIFLQSSVGMLTSSHFSPAQVHR